MQVVISGVLHFMDEKVPEIFVILEIVAPHSHVIIVGVTEVKC